MESSLVNAERRAGESSSGGVTWPKRSMEEALRREGGMVKAGLCMEPTALKDGQLLSDWSLLLGSLRASKVDCAQSKPCGEAMVSTLMMRVLLRREGV